MYINNILNTEPLFVQFSIPFLDQNTMLANQTLIAETDNPLTRETQALDKAKIPVAVRVNRRIMNLSVATEGVNSNIDSAVSMSQKIEGYLDNLISIIDDMSALQVESDDVDHTDSEREAMNEEFQEMLSIFDDYYRNVTYEGDYILQGGDFYVASGVEGEVTSVTFANVDKGHLGIAAANISTQSGAAAAEALLENAKSDLQGQKALAEIEQENLMNRRSVNEGMSSSIMYSLTDQLEHEDYYSKAEELFEEILRSVNNSLIGIIEKMDNQLLDLTVNNLNNVKSDLVKYDGEVKYVIHDHKVDSLPKKAPVSDNSQVDISE